jgi:hypothetical protein
MKIKSWSKYFIYITLLILLILLREYVEKLFSASYYRYEDPAFFYYAGISLLLGVGIGLFLGLEHFIREHGKEGTWKINLPKLILVGLPSLFFSLSNILFFSDSQFVREIITYPLLSLFRHSLNYISIFQIILGYVIITSCSKCSGNNLN